MAESGSLGGRGTRVGVRIRDAREACVLINGGRATQRWLADSTTPPRTSQQISRFEKGQELPQVSALLEMYHALRGPQTRNHEDPAELASWIADWVEDRVERELPVGDALLDEAMRMVGRSAAEGARPRASGPLQSLADFPGDEPLTVILGDRREPRAKTAADCFIYSGSTTDAMYLPFLERHMERTVVRSDKLLVRMPNDYLERMPELSERNLLIIGSPAVNWGARILNKKDTIFPFRIDEDVVTRDEEFRADDRLQDDSFASIFWELARGALAADGGVKLNEKGVRDRVIREGEDQRMVDGAVELAQRILKGSTAKTVMNRFRSLGILDLADQENHAQVTYDSNDFAVVTMARNPWSRSGQHRAVVCGGIHGPGTASAVRELLLRPERFARHPLGAVLEVKLRLDLDWPTRFEKATVSFQTKEYSALNVLDHLERAIAQPPEDRNAVFRLMSDEALRNRRDFVHALCLENG